MGQSFKLNDEPEKLVKNQIELSHDNDFLQFTDVFSGAKQTSSWHVVGKYCSEMREILDFHNPRCSRIDRRISKVCEFQGLGF